MTSWRAPDAPPTTCVPASLRAGGAWPHTFEGVSLSLPPPGGDYTSREDARELRAAAAAVIQRAWRRKAATLSVERAMTRLRLVSQSNGLRASWAAFVA
eukprot:199694-Chlamydomonas_euryale.AAC.1